MIAIEGGVSAAKKLMGPANGANFQLGFQRLIPNNLHLSVEHVMLDERFQRLFTKDELDVARWRLDQGARGQVPEELRKRAR
jgi:hypothetical protein